MVPSEDALKIARRAKDLRDESNRYKQPRLNEIKGWLDLYNNKVQATIPGYFNVPIPVVGGFVDTLLSKTDEPMAVTLGPTTEADYTRAKLMTAALKYDMGDEEADWSASDRQERKIAIFSGKGISKIYCESDPKYRSVSEAVEFEDHIFDPLGKEDLETHLYVGQDGILKTKQSLKGYNQQAVNDVFNRLSDPMFRQDTDEFQRTQDRYITLNLNPYDHSRAGVPTAQFVEMGLEWEDGERYYVFFEARTGLPLEVCLWKERFASGLWCWTSWSTHEDTKNYLNKTPLHDIVPVAEAIQIVFNMTMDNVRKRNMAQRIFDPNLIPNPAQLRQFIPDGLIEFASNAVGKSLSDAVMTLETPDTTAITENLINFLDSFIGQKTGVTPSSQGAGAEKQATILMSNLRQVADRLGLYNKYYTRAQRRKVLRWAHGQYEHMPPKRVLKTIGANGMIEWMTLMKKDARPEFDIIITSPNAEEENDALNKQAKANALNQILANPLLLQNVSQKKAVEELLKVGNYTDEEIAEFLDVDTYGNRDIIAAAAEACEQIMKGQNPTIEVNFQANEAFLMYIHNFVKKVKSANKSEFIEALLKLNDLFNRHVPVVMMNAQSASGAAIPGVPQAGQMQPEVIPPAMEGTPPGQGAPTPTLPSTSRLNIPTLAPSG